MSREKICRRVVGNLDDYREELEAKRSQADMLESALSKLEQDLSDAILRSAESGGGVGRRPAVGGRGGRLGIAVDILTGVGGALLSDNSSEIRGIKAEIERTRSDLERVNQSIKNIVQNVRSQQSKFNEYQCYNLGYSHQVLNIRSADEVLKRQLA